MLRARSALTAASSESPGKPSCSDMWTPGLARRAEAETVPEPREHIQLGGGQHCQGSRTPGWVTCQPGPSQHVTPERRGEGEGPGQQWCYPLRR